MRRASALGLTSATLVAALWACGSFEDASDPVPLDDGGVEASAPPVDGAADGGTDAGARCDLAAPFGTPVYESNVNKGESTLAPNLTPDEFTIYVSRFDGVFWHIEVASRAKRTDEFGETAVSAASRPSRVTMNRGFRMTRSPS